MLPLLLLRLVIAGVLLYALYNFYGAFTQGLHIRRMKRLELERSDATGLPLFQVEFPEMDADMLRYVYYRLGELVWDEDFPVFPEDNLASMSVQYKDLQAFLKEMTEKYGGNFTTAENNLAAEPVQTARDVVNWIGKATLSEGPRNGTI